MLRFILRRQTKGALKAWFSEQEFLQKVAMFKVADMKSGEAFKSIKELASSEGLLATQSKLFLQLRSSLNDQDLKTARETYLQQAEKIFSNPKNYGRHGSNLRTFIIRAFSGKLFTFEELQRFVNNIFLNQLHSQTNNLTNISLEVFINILESCVFNGVITPAQLKAATKVSIDKLPFGENKIKALGNLVLLHGFMLKKNLNRLKDPYIVPLIESLFEVINQSINHCKGLPVELLPDFVVLMSSLSNLQEVFEKTPYNEVFAEKFSVLQMSLEKELGLNKQHFSTYFNGLDEQGRLDLLENLNLQTGLYVSDGVKEVILGTFSEKLKKDVKKLDSTTISQMISVCARIDRKFFVSPQFIGGIEFSQDDVLNSLKNAENLLSVFVTSEEGSDEMKNEIVPLVMKIEKFVTGLLANPELLTDKNILKSLVQIFQNLVQLNRGSVGLFKAYFEAFSDPKVLDLMGPMVLFIKFLPALGVKTKKLAGALTNISDQNTANILGLTKDVAQEVKVPLEKIWRHVDSFIVKNLNMIELEKLPTILIHFIYGQIIVNDMQIFKQATTKLKGNMYKYTPKQLAQVVYSLSRINSNLVVDIITEGVNAFSKLADKYKDKLSNERVMVLWGSANCRTIDLDVFVNLIKQEIPFISSHNDRVFVQFIHAIGIISPELDEKTYKDLLEGCLKFLETKGKTMSLNEVLSSAYHILLFDQKNVDVEVTNKIFNEFSHLIANNQKFLSSNFMLIYYLYLILSHRQIRGAPKPELLRIKEVVSKYQLEILENFANSKREQLSFTEQYVKNSIVENQERLKIKKIADKNDTRVLEANSMNFLLLPSENVKSMLQKKQSLKGFTENCLLIPYTLDIMADDYAIEVNGPFHYYVNLKTGKRDHNGHSKIKKEFIEKVGLNYIDVPFWEVDKARNSQAAAEAADKKTESSEWLENLFKRVAN